MRTGISFVALLAIAVPLTVCAQDGAPKDQDCNSYPYQDGILPEPVDGGVKLISTASVDVAFDDVTSVNIARQEAELAAKAKISKFLNEDIKDEQAIDQIVDTSKTLQGNEKVSKQEVKSSLKKLTTISSASLVKGIVYLGQCVTPGKELRYTVGIKPETIANANALAANLQAGGIGNSGVAKPGSAAGAPKNQLQPVPGMSDTSRLNNF